MTAVKPAPPASGAPAPAVRPGYARGSVWMVLSDPARPAVGTEIWSNRPAVVVSNSTMNSRSGFVSVVYLSTSPRKRSGPTHVPIPGFDGAETTMALCEQVHTVDVSRLSRRIGLVSRTHMRDIDGALNISLSIGRGDGHGIFRKWEEYIKLNGIDVQAEISALAGRTADERVAALTTALDLVTKERDAYRQLVEASAQVPGAMNHVTEALASARHHDSEEGL